MKPFLCALAVASAGIISACLPGFAADHLATARDAGGVVATTHDSPGDGSPLSGLENTTPAADVEAAEDHAPTKENPASLMDKTAPSANSTH
jgi:hypothetical protein